jgi:hypothetical protein
MKRKTKQREIEERSALRRRVLDMAFGAFGSYSNGLDPDSADHMGMFGAMCPDSLGRWIGAVKDGRWSASCIAIRWRWPSSGY